MTTNNVFKKYDNDFYLSDNNSNHFKKNNNNVYVPPARRCQTQNIESHLQLQSFEIKKNNHFISSLKKASSRPLYRVTEEKLRSYDIFPELNNNTNTSVKAEWNIKKSEETNNTNDFNENNDSNKLHVPEGWLLLSDLNKGKTISQIEKEKEERYYDQLLEQYYVDMRYLMKERNAIKKKLYISCGEYFGHDSIILRDIPLKLDFMNESDEEVEHCSSDSEDNNSVQEVEYDYEERY